MHRQTPEHQLEIESHANASIAPVHHVLCFERSCEWVYRIHEHHYMDAPLER